MTTQSYFLIDNRDFGVMDAFLSGWLRPDNQVLWGLEVIANLKPDNIERYFLFSDNLPGTQGASFQHLFGSSEFLASDSIAFVDGEHYPVEVHECEINLDALSNFSLNFVGRTTWHEIVDSIGSADTGTEIKVRCSLPVKGIIISGSEDLSLVEKLYPEILWDILHPAEGGTWAIPRPTSQLLTS